MMNYNRIGPDTAAALKAAAGAGNYIDGADIGADMSHDERALYGTAAPEAVIYAESTEQVAEVLKVCAAKHIPVTTRGAGTGLAGGAVAAEGGVVLCTARMNRIIGYNETDMTVTVEPGVTLSDLNRDAAAHGLRYAPDPGEKTASIGGNAATNAGGPSAGKYGSTADNVINIKAVLADGEICEFGCGVRKCNDGYNLMQLMLGSEGTLGVVTELTLRLRPAVKASMGFIFPFDSMESCISAAAKLRASGLEPEIMEFMDRGIVRFSSEVSGNEVFPLAAGGEDVGAVLYADFAGENDDQLGILMETIGELSEELMPLDVLVVDDPTTRRNVEEAHEALHSCVESACRLFDESNAAVPMSAMCEYIESVKAYAAEEGLDIQLFGHAGDGNVHVYVYNKELDEAAFREKAGRFMDKNYAKCRELHGAVTAEHGIGSGKKKYLAQSAGETQLRLMRGIKAVFDPEMILNPGKIF